MEKFIYDKEKLPQIVLDAHPEWIALYDDAWKRAFVNVDYTEKEGWKPFLSCIPGLGRMWQWDSCFMAMYTRYSNGTITALNNLDNLYRLADKETGFISMAYDIDTDAPAVWAQHAINPPLMAWAEWENYEQSGDASRFTQVLPVLYNFYQFIEREHKAENGSYTFGRSNDSGMDNAPRGDNSRQVAHIDLACQQALSAMYMAKMYEVCGDEEKKAYFEQEHTRIKELINRIHWNEKTGFYYDVFVLFNNVLNHKTAAAFWCLISDVAEGERKRRVIEHMFNEEEFYTPHPFASLSMDDPNFDPLGGYWLGGVWPPTNYAAMRGLKNTGRWYLGREAAIKHVSKMCDIWQSKEYGSIWECYSPMKDRPSNGKGDYLVRSNFVGWSALGPIAELIENILGFRFSAPENMVEWYLYDQGRYGIENICFGDNRISLVCESCTVEKVVFKAKAEKAFTLKVKMPYRDAWGVYEVQAGESEFFL